MNVEHRTSNVQRRTKNKKPVGIAHSTALNPCKKNFYMGINIDDPVKSRKTLFSVIPAKDGIQSYQWVTACLGSGFHRSDDFLRNRQH